MAEISNHLINVIFQTTGAELTAANIAKIKTALGGVKADVVPAAKGMGDFERALKRAAIVAPVWMAIRTSIKATLDFIRDGVKYIFELEDAMHNVTSTLQDLGKNGKENMQILVEGFHNLAVESGKSETSIANAFAGVNRVLQDRERSLIATQEATKLSLETGADAAKLAESMAFLYKLQGDSLKGLTTDAEKFQEISALLYVTQAKTPGGIEKLIGDIKSFSAAMNVTDFGLENTIRLFGALESAGVSNTMALRTGLLRLLTNLGDASKMLGISFPENVSSAEVFLKVLERLSTAMKTPGDKSGVMSVLKDLFGSVIRGGTNLGSLAKDIDAVQQALAGKGVSAGERNLQLEQLKLVTEEADHQIKVFQELRNQSAKTFMAGLLGGEDLGKGMTDLNKGMKENVNVWNEFGKGIRDFATAKWFTSMFPGMVQISAQQTINKELKEQVNTEKQIVNEKTKQNAKTSEAMLMTKKQAEEVEDLLLQYEKATPEEKPALRRKIELSQMTEQNQMFAFSTSKEDRALLLEMASKLTDSVKAAIAGTISYEQGIYTQGRFTPSLNEPGKGGLVNNTITNIGAKEIAINVDLGGAGMPTREEMITLITNEAGKALLADEEFLNILGKKLPSKLQGGK